MSKDKLSYTIRIEYAGTGFTDLSLQQDWHRDFRVPESITLEELHLVIQRILNWDGAHLYEFEIGSTAHAFVGLDDLTVEDFSQGKYVSCAVPLSHLGLAKEQQFTYIFDFGDMHKFQLTVSGVEAIDKVGNPPALLACVGDDLVQYPSSDISHMGLEPMDYVNLPQEVRYERPGRDSRWRVRFILGRDKEILEQWRRSGNKKLWERAVAILDNWDLGLPMLSFKIERPVGTIKEWVRTFNEHGIEGIQQLRKKMDRTKAQEKAELRKKRILEILHDRPMSLGINRSNWNL